MNNDQTYSVANPSGDLTAGTPCLNKIGAVRPGPGTGLLQNSGQSARNAIPSSTIGGSGGMSNRLCGKQIVPDSNEKPEQ
jgi:hypothetical protein